MSAPRVPFKFISGDQLNPSHLMANLQQIAADVTKSQDRQWTYSSFVLDFSGVASGDRLSERHFVINAPKAFEIVSIELQVYQASGQTISLTCDATNSTVCSVATAGATTLASENQTQTGVRVAKDTDVKFTYSSTGGKNTACWAVIHIRSSRWSDTTRTEYGVEDVLRINTGDVPLAGDLNTEFTEIEAAVTADTGAQDDLKIQVISYRALGAASIPTHKDRWYVPASGRKFSRIKSYVVTAAAGTDDFTITLFDEANVSQGAAAITANTTGDASTQDTSSATAISDAQPTDPLTSGSDYYVKFTRSATVDNCRLWYAVLSQV